MARPKGPCRDPRPSLGPKVPRVARWVGLLLGLVLVPGLAAQSLTGGALRGEIVTADGIPVPGMSLTLEDQGGLELRRLQSDTRGQFSVPLLEPGRYRILAERLGFQPLRQHGIQVLAEAVTVVRIRVERRPPPITSVSEVEVADQRFTSTSPRVADLLGGGPTSWWAPSAAISSDARASAAVVAPFDDRPGLGFAIGGLPTSYSRILVDGLPVTWMRHPGIEPEPGPTPLLPRFLTQQAVLALGASDAEWNGGNGSQLGAVTRSASPRFRVEPFGFWSGGVGIPKSSNPADSSVTSYTLGTTLAGPLVPGRATVIMGFALEGRETPSEAPWTVDRATLNGNSVDLSNALESVALNAHGRAIRGHTRPVVRETRGGSGGFRVDWRLDQAWTLTTRATLARFKEHAPLVTADLSNGSGTRLDARDYSVATSLSFARGNLGNELRLGFRGTERDWQGASIPPTLLAAEGVGIGGLPATPGEFSYKSFDLSDAVQHVFGNRGQHRIKVGVQYSTGYWTQDHLPGSRGSYTFGSLDDFEDLEGSFMVTEAPSTRARFKLVEAGLFGQAAWQFMPGLTGILGIRYDRQKFPLNRGQYIRNSTQFQNDFGLSNSALPNDRDNWAPRLGFTWSPEGTSGWSAGIFAARSSGQLNPARFAEAMLNDGGTTVRRAVGDLGSWPGLPDSTVAPRMGPRFTLFSPRGNYKNPRTTRVDAELSRRLGVRGTIRAFGGYHHTDFLLRRRDLNLLDAPSGLTQEGRPVYGTLEQVGGLVVPVPGSNRRVAGYDMVSALISDGFQNHYQAGLSFQTELGTRLTISGTYLWSRTRDNWLAGWTGTPEDELTPFADDRPGNEWAEGVSDFDVPHRAVVEATWRLGGGLPIRLGARYRIRSGLPFTPGFRPGVDPNGDGSGRNDPAFIDPAIPGMPALLARNPCLEEQSGEMAERNSCREEMNHGLDLSLALGLPLRSLGGRLELLVDVFNVASSRVGVVDKALVLIDPAGTTTTDGLGNVTLPLVANPHFGKLQSRRTDPRVVRFGLRLAP